MRRIYRETAYDLKEPGVHIWIIPLTALAFIVLTYFLQKNMNIDVLTLSLLEVLIPSLGGYGTIMLMQGLLDTEGGELGFAYPRSYLYWGLIRQFRFFILHSILTAAVCEALALILHVDFLSLFYLTVIQSFAVMAVSFLGVIAGKKVSIGLIVLIAFIGIQLTLGREYNIFNRIYIINGAIPSHEQLNSVLYNSLFIGVFGWGIGQVWLRP
ncbi:MAG: hypothetical protein VB118_01215 [Oscillospiraceae bacterium]|nr:hypothetical protein [Oscillospiraceae bacterium]